MLLSLTGAASSQGRDDWDEPDSSLSEQDSSAKLKRDARQAFILFATCYGFYDATLEWTESGDMPDEQRKLLTKLKYQHLTYASAFFSAADTKEKRLKPLLNRSKKLNLELLKETNFPRNVPEPDKMFSESQKHVEIGKRSLGCVSALGIMAKHKKK